MDFPRTAVLLRGRETQNTHLLDVLRSSILFLRSLCYQYYSGKRCLIPKSLDETMVPRNDDGIHKNMHLKQVSTFDMRANVVVRRGKTWYKRKIKKMKKRRGLDIRAKG